MEFKNKDGLTEKEFLANYKPGDYERPSVTADILLFTIESNEKDIRYNEEKFLKLLLIKRNNHPFINTWALPGGFVDMTESIEESAYRELKEETNITENVYLEQLYTFSKPNRDPRMRVISTAFMALTPVSNIKNTQAGDDASDAKWFTVSRKLINDTNEETTFQLKIFNDDIKIIYNVVQNYKNKSILIQLNKLSNSALAFDHIEIINMALTRLRNKVNYTSIAFNLLPEKFTLTDLQQVYEILLDEKLVKPNFRKKISNMVIKTNERKSEIVAYNPPYLYMKNPKYCDLN